MGLRSRVDIDKDSETSFLHYSVSQGTFGLMDFLTKTGNAILSRVTVTLRESVGKSKGYKRIIIIT